MLKRSQTPVARRKRATGTTIPRGQSAAHREARALAKQAKPGNVSETERRFADMLAARGFEFVPQQAIGGYNVDLGCHPVAVEIYGGNWHYVGRAAERFEARTRFLLERGWFLLIVWIDERRYPLNEAAADYFAALHQTAKQLLESGRTKSGQYRVIRGDGEHIASGGRYNCGVENALPFRKG